MNLDQTVIQVHIEDIIPNRFQPRLNFDEKSLQELAESIKEHGIIQPLVLRKLGDKYEIIAGERRFKAAQIAGLSTVPAVISNIDDNKAAEVAIAENVQRVNLTAIEEARSYKNLLDKGYLTQEGLAKKMGLSQPAIANKLRLLNLDDEVQQALLDEKISERHARTLLTIPNKEAQREWLHRIINERLTVRQLDMELKKSNIQTEDNSEDDETGGGVPLVNSKPSIEDMKANSVDIFDKGKKMTVEEMMKPTEVINEEIETLDMDDNTQPEPISQPVIEAPNSTDNWDENPFEQEEKPEDNKFFNFTENQEVKKEEEPLSTKEESSTNNGFEIIDFSNNNEKDNNQNNPFLTADDNNSDNKEETSYKPINMEDNSRINTEFNISSNNKFFTPTLNERQEVELINKEEKVENPMDRVKELAPSYQEDEEDHSDTTLKDTINTIRNCLEGLGKKGVYAEVEEIDFQNYYQITIKIPKDN